MTKTATVTAAELAEVLRYEPETGKLYWLPRDNVRPCWNGKHAGREAFTYQHAEGYKVGTYRKTYLKAHRVAWALHFGYWPTEVDHINGVRSDNRIENLREVSASENSRNRGLRSDNKSGHNGVCWDSRDGKWLVQIMHKHRNKYVGGFDNLDDAVAARKAAEVQYGYHENHGRTNRG